MKKIQESYYCDICNSLIEPNSKFRTDFNLSFTHGKITANWITGTQWEHLCVLCQDNIVDAVDKLKEQFCNIRIKR